MRVLLISLFILLSCDRETSNSNCRYLARKGVMFTINLSLPEFNPLQYPSNSVYVAGQGNGGVIVTHNGTGLVAWDAADPNHPFSSCSAMDIKSGIIAQCNCEDANQYSLITGQSLDKVLPCTLLNYRVEQTGQGTYLISD